jgi:hypothetical protein
MVLTPAFLGASVLRTLGGDLTNPVSEDLLAKLGYQPKKL